MEIFILTHIKESMVSQKPCEVNADVFFNIDGIIHKEFIPPGQTVSTEVLLQCPEAA